MNRKGMPMTDNNLATEENLSKVPTRILRLPEVMHRVGLKRASIYHAIAKSSFPKQVALNQRSVGWIEQEIEDWLTARIKNSRPQQE
jgi:prophage regulatory protein